jgi:hypothetical protein
VGIAPHHHPFYREEDNDRVGSLVRVVENLSSLNGHGMSTSLDDTKRNNGATAQGEVNVMDSDNFGIAQLVAEKEYGGQAIQLTVNEEVRENYKHGTE